MTNLQNYFLYPSGPHLRALTDMKGNVLRTEYASDFGAIPLPDYSEEWSEEELEGYLSHLDQWASDDYIAGGELQGAPSFKEWRDGQSAG
jgi:hypothetical protein